MKDKTMDEANVERFIDEVIKEYWERNLLQDALFWREAIRLLKRKERIGSRKKNEN